MCKVPSDPNWKRRSVGLLVATVLFAFSTAASARSDTANSFDLTVALDPSDGALSVAGTIDIVADKRTDEIEMLLNGKLRIDRMSFSREARMQTENGITFGTYSMPNTQRIRIALGQPMERGDERVSRLHTRAI